MEKLKKRKICRKTKRIILISTEGKNKTEETYFNHFKNNNKNYVIKFAKGNDTDPSGIFYAAQKTMQKEELDFEQGDLVYCVFDVDFSQSRKKDIEYVLKKSKKENIHIILSNPCFEIWFLLHYRYSTRIYESNDAVVNDLQKYLPGYEKKSDIFDLLKDHSDDAIKYSKKLKEYHQEMGNVDIIDCNPSTDIYKIIETL